jgi:PPOX class probable F420-dependent enzyme
MTEQRHGRRIMMTPDERDAFLAEQRTCRVATVSADGRPHATPLWYAWDGSALWLYSITRSRRWAELAADPRIAAVVDAGARYGELRGVELTGEVEQVGEAPRTGLPHPELERPERLFASRYGFGPAMVHDRRHAWLRLTPRTVTSWDFRKLHQEYAR